jgi:hypothetical protein
MQLSVDFSFSGALYHVNNLPHFFELSRLRHDVSQTEVTLVQIRIDAQRALETKVRAFEHAAMLEQLPGIVMSIRVGRIDAQRVPVRGFGLIETSKIPQGNNQIIGGGYQIPIQRQSLFEGAYRRCRTPYCPIIQTTRKGCRPTPR